MLGTYALLSELIILSMYFAAHDVVGSDEFLPIRVLLQVICHPSLVPFEWLQLLPSARFTTLSQPAALITDNSAFLPLVTRYSDWSLLLLFPLRRSGGSADELMRPQMLSSKRSDFRRHSQA